MSRISALVRGTPGMAGRGTMILPARCSALAPGRFAIVGKLGTSARMGPDVSRSMAWQLVHRRAASSRPRPASAGLVGCAQDEPSGMNRLQVVKAMAAPAFLDTKFLTILPRIT